VTRFRIVMLALLMQAYAPLATTAQEPENRPPEPPTGRGPLGLVQMVDRNPGRLIQELELDENQATEVRTLLEEFKQENRDALARFRQMMRERQDAGRRRGNSGSTSGRAGQPRTGGRGGMQDMGSRHGNPMRDLQEPLAGLRADIEALLTAEQRTRFREMQRTRRPQQL